MRPNISIIVPTFNEEIYIENCLKSIRNQNYKGKYEIIISDGGSEDNTLKIAKKHKVKVIIDKRRGIAIGRNSGARAAKGEILLFIDGDTLMMPNLLTEFAKSFENKKVVGVTCPIIPMKMDTKSLATYLSYNNLSRFSLKTMKPFVAGICVAYRFEDFFEIGGFDENLHALEDIDLSERISKLGKIVFNLNTFAVTSTRRLDKWGGLMFFQRLSKLYVKFLTKKMIRINEYRPVR